MPKSNYPVIHGIYDPLSRLDQLQRQPYFFRRRYLKSPPNNYPRFLYKYISPDIDPEYLTDFIVNGHLWLSSITKFNDPFEMKAKVTHTAPVQQKRKKYSELVKSNNPNLSKLDHEALVTKFMVEQNIDSVKKAFEQNTIKAGLFCMSEDPRSLLMWSHYAREHKGIVIQFELARDLRSMMTIFPVEYCNEYPTFDFFDDTETQFGKIMLRKSSHWSYEKEWRILHIGGASHYLKFDPNVIRGIILGCRISTELRDLVFQVVSQRVSRSLDTIKIYQSAMHDSQYGLVLKSINH